MVIFLSLFTTFSLFSQPFSVIFYFAKLHLWMLVLCWTLLHSRFLLTEEQCVHTIESLVKIKIDIYLQECVVGY